MTTPLARRLAIALVASLAINLFLGGMATSRWLFHAPPGAHGAGPDGIGHFNRRAAHKALDAGARKRVEAVWRDRIDDIRPRIRAARKARHAVMRELMAEPIDATALDAAYAALRARTDEAQTAVHGVLAEVAQMLPPDQRRRFFRAGLTRRDRKHVGH